jgi:hypothetical protein
VGLICAEPSTGDDNEIDMATTKLALVLFLGIVRAHDMKALAFVMLLRCRDLI